MTVAWLSDGTTGHCPRQGRTGDVLSVCPLTDELGPLVCFRDHGTSGVAAKSQRASRRRCGVVETTVQPGRRSSGDRPVHLGRLDARGRPDRGRGAGRTRHQGVGRGRPGGSGPRSGSPSRIAGRDPSWPRRPAGGAHVPGRDRADAAAPLPRRRPRTGSVTGSAGSEHSRSARDGGRRPSSSARGRRGRLRTGGRLALLASPPMLLDWGGSQRLTVDAEILRDMRDRAAALNHEAHRALAQLLRVLLRGRHR